VTTQELQSWLRGERGLVLVHVSSPTEFAREHIAQSINVPAEDPRLAERVRAALGHDAQRPIVVYGADGDPGAALRALEGLRRAGLGPVYHYAGGIRAWREAGIMLEGQPGSGLEDG
jgi:rhodanese-related sulfurtransferase